jgi:hypothetical protein
MRGNAVSTHKLGLELSNTQKRIRDYYYHD